MIQKIPRHDSSDSSANGKSLVLNTQSSKFGIIGPDDLDEVGYIAHILGLEDDEAGEVEDFLNEIIV